MTRDINSHKIRWLLAAGLSFGVATANAATGYSITESQEATIAPGMSAAEVQHSLGRPAEIDTDRNASGSTWTYEVDNAPFGAAEFDVDFGPDGKVVSVDERVLGDD